MIEIDCTAMFQLMCVFRLACFFVVVFCFCFFLAFFLLHCSCFPSVVPISFECL